MKTKSCISAIIILLLTLNISLIGQNKELKGLQILSIQVNDGIIQPGQWDKISIRTEDNITFYFTPPEAVKGTVKYKAYLNGIILAPESGFSSNYLKLENLTKGSYIVKIVGMTNEGQTSAVQHFEVINPGGVNPGQVKNNDSGILNNWMSNTSIYTIIISVLFIFQIIVIVFLTGKKKSRINDSMKNDLLQEELTDLRYVYKRMKEEIKNQTEENTYLQKQIKDLEKEIKNLENANTNLIKQKQKLAESKRQLEELQIQKEELFAIAVHDIKNPASAIRGCIDLLNSYDLNAMEQQEILTSLISSSENIMKLSQEMCTIIAQSKPEPALKKGMISLKGIIDEVCLNNTPYAKAKNIRIMNRSAIGLPDISADESKIQDVIENLVNNGIKYGPPETIIEIRTYVKNKSIFTEISDTGVGLTKEDLEKVFKKGAILSAKPTGMEKSSGIGLWVVKKIVEEHKGRVWVESKPGIGSTFGFEIPMKEII